MKIQYLIIIIYNLTNLHKFLTLKSKIITAILNSKQIIILVYKSKNKIHIQKYTPNEKEVTIKLISNIAYKFLNLILIY